MTCPTPDKPARCPRCNTRGIPDSDRRYWCPSCKLFFDDEPDEGGDYSDRNPAARLERERARRGIQRRRTR